MTDFSNHLAAMRRLARKYKAMGLPVQRRNAAQDALFWRRFVVRPKSNKEARRHQ